MYQFSTKVVVLAPGCDMDPGLEVKLKHQRGVAHCCVWPHCYQVIHFEGGMNSTVEDSEVVEAWNEAAKRFAVWCGQAGWEEVMSRRQAHSKCIKFYMISQRMQLMSLEVFDRKFAQKLPGEIAVTHLNVSPIARGKQGALLSF